MIELSRLETALLVVVAVALMDAGRSSSLATDGAMDSVAEAQVPVPQVAGAVDPPVRRPLPIALDDDLTASQQAAVRTMEIVSAAWFFVVGAAVGSFLNVVIYRIPAGLSLATPPSRCPSCLTRISLRDNLPILSWLRLRGRCRACGVRIPPRYLAVEAVTGLLFLALVWFETLSGGKTLPIRPPNTYTGVVWVLWYAKWDLIGLYLYHTFLVCLLLSMALIVWDGPSIPRRLAWLALGVGLLLPLIWPDLHPVPFQVPAGRSPAAGTMFDGARDGLAGTAVGAALGDLLATAASMGECRRLARSDLTVITGAAGAFLGWQAAFSIALAAALLFAGSLAFRSCRREPGVVPRMVLSIATASILQLFFWRAQSEYRWWPGPESPPSTFGLALVLMVGACLPGRWSKRA